MSDEQVPLAQQQALLAAQFVRSYDLVAFYHQYWPEIVAAAKERHIEGFRAYGSRMYSWTPQERFQNVIEELADALVYMSSGLYSASGADTLTT